MRVRASLLAAFCAHAIACLSYSGTRVEPRLATCGGKALRTTESIDEWPVLQNESVVAEEMAKVWPGRPMTVIHAHIGVDENGAPTCATLAKLPTDARVASAARVAIERMRFSPARTAGTPRRAWTHLTLRTYLESDHAACEAGVPFACAAYGYERYNAGALDDAQRALERACELGDIDTCRSFGKLRAERGDPVAAVPIWERACAAGSAGACTSLGFALENGSGVLRDRARAVALYERACAGMDAYGCNNLGILVARGLGVEKDPGRALALFEEACALGHRGACGSAGQRLVEGRGVPRNDARGREHFSRGCRLGHPASCNWLGKMAGWDRQDADQLRLYERGCALETTHCLHLLVHLRTREVQPEREREIGGAAWRASVGECEADRVDEIGCNFASVIARCGFGVEPDVERAAALANRACNDDELRPEACLAAGRAHLRLGDAARAESSFARACDLDIGDACDALASLVAQRDAGAALASWDRGCGLGSAAACAQQAERIWTRDPVRARSLAGEACHRGHGAGCRLLALADGSEGAFSAARIAAQLRQACTLGDAPACRALADRYRRGDGVVASIPAAAELEARAARIEVDPACYGS